MIPTTLICEVCKKVMTSGVDSADAKFCDRCGRICCAECSDVAGAEVLANHKWCKVCRAEREVLGGQI